MIRNIAYFLSESIGKVSEENCSQTVVCLLILTCSSHVSSKILDDKNVIESSDHVHHVDLMSYEYSVNSSGSSLINKEMLHFYCIA
jgi:hypothetical protein